MSTVSMDAYIRVQGELESASEACEKLVAENEALRESLEMALQEAGRLRAFGEESTRILVEAASVAATPRTNYVANGEAPTQPWATSREVPKPALFADYRCEGCSALRAEVLTAHRTVARLEVDLARVTAERDETVRGRARAIEDAEHWRLAFEEARARVALLEAALRQIDIRNCVTGGMYYRPVDHETVRAALAPSGEGAS